MALDWTREELILALCLYFDSGADNTGKYPDSTSPAAKELSDALRRLSAYPKEEQSANYRSGDAVRQKLRNLATAQNTGFGESNGSRLDKSVLWEFFTNRDELFAEAAAIRAGIESGSAQSGHPDIAVSEVPIAVEVEIERQHTSTFPVSPSDIPRIARREEAQLVHAYSTHMSTQGVAVNRKRYEPPGEPPMFSDAWVQARNLLIEAKFAQGRKGIREAIGQLYDYRRFHQPRPHLAVLLSYEPTGDRRALLDSASIAAIWPKPRGGFGDTANGTYV
jgi:hypothetical protein